MSLKGLDFRLGVIAQHVRCDEVLEPGPGMADADAHAPKIRAEARVDRAQAVVAGEPAADLDLHLERRKIELVMEDGERFLVELVEVQRLLNRVAAVVHEGLGLQQQDAMPADPALRQQAAKLLLPRSEFVALGDDVRGHEPDIVPVKRVSHAGISEADPQLHGGSLAGAGAKKKPPSLWG